LSFTRILFVYPETRYPTGQPHLGIASLAAVIRRAGAAETALCDMSLQKDPLGELERQLRAFAPDLVAVTVMTTQLETVARAAAAVRRLAPQAVLACGGPHATVMPEDLLARTGADLAYAGEGEIGFLRFVAGEDPAAIPGACFRRDGAFIRVPGLLLTEDLDSLPFPDRSLFDMERYFRLWYSMDRVDSRLRGTTIMASRGCPYGCTFCQPTLSELFGRKIRKRSPAHIADELESLRAAFGITAFMFEDSTFILDKQWVHAICDELLGRRLALRWCCNVRANLLDEELLAHMKAAGLAKINMGVESASQRVLDEIYQKGITVEGVRRALDLAKAMGIYVQGYFMLGAPGETRAEMEATVRFAVDNPFDDALFDITTPFPHTTLWDRTRHLVVRDFDHFDFFQNCVYDLGDIPAREIERMKTRAFWRFYFHPSRVLRTAATVLGPRNLARTLAKAKRV